MKRVTKKKKQPLYKIMRKLAPLRKFSLAGITMQHSKFECFFCDEFSETWLRHNTPVTYVVIMRCIIMLNRLRSSNSSLEQ